MEYTRRMNELEYGCLELGSGFVTNYSQSAGADYGFMSNLNNYAAETIQPYNNCTFGNFSYLSKLEEDFIRYKKRYGALSGNDKEDKVYITI